MKIIFLLLLTTIVLFAQNDYSLRVAYGKSTESDLGEILIGRIAGDVDKLYTFSLDGGYRIQENLFEKPLDLYVKSSVSYFNEANIHDDIYEFALYIKLYYTFSWLDHGCRFGFGEGGSYTTGVLATEKYGAVQNNDNTSKYLNYLDISFDVDISKLFGNTALQNTYIGFLIKHRSGIFGLIHNVHHGGSNYNCVTIEKNF